MEEAEEYEPEPKKRTITILKLLWDLDLLKLEAMCLRILICLSEFIF
jgi:hypothetical protein